MTDVQLVGLVQVDPPLRAVEMEYLVAFAESRRWRRPDGPYAVPANPLAECLDPVLDLDAYVEPAEGQPGLLCPWTPAMTGRALVPSSGVLQTGVDEAVAWLDYVIEHFLGPEARAASAPECAGFGFDHVLTGAGTVCCLSSGRITHFQVRANTVHRDDVCLGWRRVG